MLLIIIMIMIIIILEVMMVEEMRLKNLYLSLTVSATALTPKTTPAVIN